MSHSTSVKLPVVIMLVASTIGCGQADQRSDTPQTDRRQAPGEAAYARGTNAHNNANYDQAIAEYDEAIRCDPGNAAFYHARGLSWAKKYDHDKAIADISHAIGIAPTSQMYNDRGWSWQHKDEYDKAIADYNKAIQLNPHYAQAYCNRSIAQTNKGDYENALNDCNKAIDLDANLADAYNSRAYLRAYEGEFDGAVQDYTKAIEIDPDIGDYAGRGYAWKNLADYQKAIDDLDKAIQLDPSAYAPMQQLADIYSCCPNEEFRNAEKALELAKRACELTNDMRWECLDALASAYAEAGHFDQAVQWQEKAILLVPEDWLDSARERLNLYRAGKPFRDVP